MKAKYLFLDVDGTLTDGKLYIGATGEVFKAFDVKDGCGIKDIYPQYGGKVIIMTARHSEILQKRCEELNVDMLFQGVRNKAEKLAEIADEFSIEKNGNGVYEGTAYMGDDILDIPGMVLCEYRGAPKDAVKQVTKVATFLSQHNGGNGAVREFIEYLCDV